MSDPYFQRLFAERIGGAGYGKGTDIYKFEKIKRAKRQALADHPERTLIDFGIGENDGMAPESVRRSMADEIGKPENRGYADNGIPAFKEAVARFMQRTFGVTLDPATEINHCIGSKPALAMISAFITPRTLSGAIASFSPMPKSMSVRSGWSASAWRFARLIFSNL